MPPDYPHMHSAESQDMSHTGIGKLSPDVRVEI